MNITKNKVEKLLQEQLKTKECLLSLKANSGLTREQFAELSEARTQIAWCEDVLGTMSDRARRIREESNLGERFKTRTFETYDADSGDRDAFKKCHQYAKGLAVGMPAEKNGLILSGGAGIGKTHLAAAIANEVIDSGTPVIFSTFTDLLKREREAIQKSKHSMVATCMDIPLLILDDLGKEKQSEWVDEILFQIVNHRYEAMLPIIITTNLSMKELYSLVGHAVFGRLMETCEVLNVKGEDRRTPMK